MATFNAIIDGLLSGYFAAFSWSPAIGLLVFSALSGVGMLWVFARTSKPDRIRAAKRRVYAHLLEMRVYNDEPGVMWRAQTSLLAANLRYMGLMLRPALWMGLPLAVLLIHLDSFYGREPLAVGRDTIVTAAMRAPLDARGPAPVLEAPHGIAVETPAVRVLAERQVSWRIRPAAAVSGTLRLTAGGAVIEKNIEAGAGPRFVPGRRVSSSFAALSNPGEPLIPAGPVEWVEVRYGEASVAMFGIRMHWLVWFLIFSMLSALLLKKRFRVVL